MHHIIASLGTYRHENDLLGRPLCICMQGLPINDSHACFTKPLGA